jgi:hypothetical protein
MHLEFSKVLYDCPKNASCHNISTPLSLRNLNICEYYWQELETKCTNSRCQASFVVCMVSGGLIVNEESLQCSVCKHYFIASKLRPHRHCPLCHCSLDIANGFTLNPKGVISVWHFYWIYENLDV